METNGWQKSPPTNSTSFWFYSFQLHSLFLDWSISISEVYVLYHEETRANFIVCAFLVGYQKVMWMSWSVGWIKIDWISPGHCLTPLIPNLDNAEKQIRAGRVGKTKVQGAMEVHFPSDNNLSINFSYIGLLCISSCFIITWRQFWDLDIITSSVVTKLFGNKSNH